MYLWIKCLGEWSLHAKRHSEWCCGISLQLLVRTSSIQDTVTGIWEGVVSLWAGLSHAFFQAPLLCLDNYTPRGSHKGCLSSYVMRGSHDIWGGSFKFLFTWERIGLWRQISLISDEYPNHYISARNIFENLPHFDEKWTQIFSW